MDFREYKGITGIYSIKVEDRIYIGSAVDMYHRWHSHLYDFRKQKHSNKFMQNVFNKYGETALNFDIVCECSKENLITTEQGYIDLIIMFFPKDNVLNLSPTAGNQMGRALSDKQRKRISAALKGKHKSETARANMSASKKGKTIPEYVKEKIRITNTGKKLSESTKQKLSIIGKGRPHSREHAAKLRTVLKKVTDARKVTATLLSPSGELVTFTGVNGFCRDNNIDCAAIFRVLKGTQKYHKGWKLPPKELREEE